MFEKLKKNLELLKEQSPHKKPVILTNVGTFNPIHNKHVLNLEYAKKEIEKDPNLKVVGGFLMPLSPWFISKKLMKKEIIQHRVKLCELAAEDSDWIEVSEILIKYQEAFHDYGSLRGLAGMLLDSLVMKFLT